MVGFVFLTSGVTKLFSFGRLYSQNGVSFASVLALLDCTTLLSPFPSSFRCLPHSSPPPQPPLHPSASCRSVRLPVSVPIRFHLIHVTSINTQSSPDKSRPLSPPLCLSCVALHHSVFPNKLSSPQWLVTMYEITLWLQQVNSANVLRGDILLCGEVLFTCNHMLCLSPVSLPSPRMWSYSRVSSRLSLVAFSPLKMRMS